MNKHFNLVNFVAKYPELSVRRVACNSMLGVLNFSLISSADRIAQQLIREQVNVVELEPRDVRALCAAVDDQGDVSLQQMGRVKALQAEFFEVLSVAKARSLVPSAAKKQVRSLADAVRRARDKEAENKAPWGSLERALADSVGAQQAVEIKDLATKRKMLASVGLSATDEMVSQLREQTRLRNQAYADQRAQRLGLITWVIEHMFVAPTVDAWDAFTIEERQFFVDKVSTAFANAENTVARNVIEGRNGDDVLGLADVIFLRAAKAELEKAVAEPDVAKPAKPKMQRVRKDGSVQKLKDAQARKLTETLMNGVADTPQLVKRTNQLTTKLQAEANGITLN